MNTIGIIGGLGAFAGAELQRMVHVETVRLGGLEPRFVKDSHFPQVIALNVPFNTSYEADINSETLNALRSAYQSLQALGCDKIAIACNSAYLVADEFMSPSDLSLMSYVNDQIEARLKDYGFSKGMVLQSEAAEKESMYERFAFDTFDSYERRMRRFEVDDLIKRGMCGEDVQAYIRWLFGNSNVPIILGCTELCLYADLTGSDLLWEHYPPINTLQLMAQWLVEE